MKRKGQSGFTLVELLIVVAILAVLAAVVIPNVLGLMGRGASQAYETDQEVIQLATATFYSDTHAGWKDIGDNDNPADATTYAANVWGDSSATDKGHYYPTAIATANDHELYMSTSPIDEDPDNEGSFELKDSGNVTVEGSTGDALISAHAIWMGLLVNDDTAGLIPGTGDRGAAAPLDGDTALYLQEMPESASANNGSLDPGGYTWIVGKNGTVYGAYKNDDKWYAGFAGGYP